MHKSAELFSLVAIVGAQVLPTIGLFHSMRQTMRSAQANRQRQQVEPERERREQRPQCAAIEAAEEQSQQCDGDDALKPEGEMLARYQ
jgi:hypothetical protein